MTNETAIAATPSPVMGLYDEPMWRSIRAGAMELQRCDDCAGWQYPPAPVCTHCGGDALRWTPVAGVGTIVSWVVFHKTYLPGYDAPYNAIAVRLEEGPVMVSNLECPVPAGTWIGQPVRLVYTTMPDGLVLPRFTLGSAADSRP